MPPPTIVDPHTGQNNWYPQPGTRARFGEQNRTPTDADRQGRYLANWQTLTRYTQTLAQQLRRAGYLIDPDYSLSQDPDAIDKMLRDPIIQFAVRFRQRLVAGRAWSLEPKDERYKPYVPIFSDLLTRIKRFAQSRFVLSEAIFQGVSIGRFDGALQYLKLSDTAKYMHWWYPRRIVPVDKRRLRKEFVVRPESGGMVNYKYAWTIHDPEQRIWYVITRPDWYFWFIYNDEEDRLGHGRGLYDSLYVPWFMKSNLLQFGLDFSERFAAPWIKVALDAEAGDIDTLTERGQAYAEMIKVMRQLRVIWHDKRDEVDFKEASSGNQTVVDRLLDRMDEGIVRVCLANTLTTGTGDHGSRAQAEVHENSQDNAVNYDRMVFEEEHDLHLLEAVWRYNRRNLFALGFDDVPWECPFTFKLQREQRWDPSQQTEVFRLAAELKMAVRKEDFYQRFDLTEPSTDDEVIEFAQAAAPGMPPPIDDAGFSLFRTQPRNKIIRVAANTRTANWLAGAL